MVLEIWTATCKKMKLDHQLIPYAKINSRWIKDLNISHDTMKVLEVNIDRKISDIPHSNIFPDMSPSVGDIKERISKWDLIQIYIYCDSIGSLQDRRINTCGQQSSEARRLKTIFQLQL